MEAKGGEMDEGHSIHRNAERDSRVREGPEQQVEDGKVGKGKDEQCRLAFVGRGPCGRMLHDCASWVEEAGATERSGAASNGEEWGDGRS